MVVWSTFYFLGQLPSPCWDILMVMDEDKVRTSLSPLTITIFFFSQKTPPCQVKLPSRFAHSITLLCWDGPLDPKENHQIPVQGLGLEHAFRNGTSCGQGDSVQAGYSCSPWTVT